MWVCSNCMESNDDKQDSCRICYIQKDNIDHSDEFFRVTDLYSGDEIGDLTVQIGDIVKVVNRCNSDWIWVNHNKTEGWYPENHLTRHDIGSRSSARLQENAGVMASSNHYTNTKQGSNYGNISSDQENGCVAVMSNDYMNTKQGSNHDKPPVIPRRSKIVEQHKEHIRNSSESTYDNTARHAYGNTEDITKPANSLPRQNTYGKGLDDVIKSNEIVDSSDEINYVTPQTLTRQQIPARQMKNIYGNTIYQNDESTPTPPPLPDRRTFPPSPTYIKSHDLIQNTYGNSDPYFEHPNSKPPLLPGRRKSPQRSTRDSSRDLTQNTYGNTNELSDEVKKETLEVLDYEDPNTKHPENDTDEQKIDETYHIYTYIEDKYVKYTESLSKDIGKPVELTNTESGKPALPKRPPPPSRPPLPNSQSKTRNRIDENAVQMATLYGTRDKNEIRLVMVGKTGSGKSATGNTIMAKTDHFISKVSGGSVTSECKRGECSQAGRKIVVVDTPGLFDTQVPFEKISKEIIRCVNMSTPGPHAFLLVIQIARFTDEEIETFNRLFDLFGDEMGRFAIITFTKLDDLERGNSTIEAFINEAPKKMKEFLKRCQGRYIAFDNNATEKKKAVMVKNLIKLVDSIVDNSGGKYYTNDMYREAEAALQRKIKEVEETRAKEKKKEIEQIQSKFVNQIDSMKKENKKLASKISSNEILQQRVQREKENAKQEINKMKEAMKKIDCKRNAELYQMKKQEKEEKEQQAKALEEKEKQQMQILQRMQQQQVDTTRKYEELEKRKELQLMQATQEYNKRMEKEIQKIVEGSNQKYNEIMKALDAKERDNEILQEQMEQHNTYMQELMFERDTKLYDQQDQHQKQMEVEKKRASDSLRIQLDAQRKTMEDRTASILQEQKAGDKRHREDYRQMQLQNEKMKKEIEKIYCKSS